MKSLLPVLLVLFIIPCNLNAQPGSRELTTNGGSISANTNTANAVRLLDNDTSTVWTSASTGVAGGSITIRIIYASPVPIVVDEYALTVAGPYRDRDPKNWSITAANLSDFSDGVTLSGSTVSNQSFASGATKTLTFSNSQSYLYYRLSITAINGATTGTQLSEFHLFGPNSANPSPPAPPANLRATASRDSVYLTWTDMASNETGYAIERSADGSSFNTLDTLSPDAVAYIDAGLPAYTGYYYRMRALGSPTEGNSAWSPLVYITTSGNTPLFDITANNGLVSLSNGENGGKNLFDDNVETKSGLITPTGWIQFYGTFAGIVRQYTITSADNSPDKDPRSWLLLASQNGATWDTLDSRSNESFPARSFTRGYTLTNTNSYKVYRLKVTANNGNTSAVQLAELAFNAYRTVYQFVGDFEVPDTGFWRPGGRCSTCDYAIQFRQDTVRNGLYSARFELNRNDPESYVGSWRSELALNTEPRLQAERWYGFSIFLPEDYEYDPSNEILAQWHSTPDYAIGDADVQSPPLALRTEAGEWVITRRWDTARITRPDSIHSREIPLGTYQRGVWTDWVFHVRWDYGDAGLLQVWKNGHKVVEEHGPNAYNDSIGVYFKTGIYKAIWNPATSNQSTTQKRVIFIDDVRVANENATYADVAPPMLNGYSYPTEPFVPGNLVVVRVGDGKETISGNAIRVFLDEYTVNGTLVRSLPLPITADSANKLLTLTNSSNEGLLTLSPDSSLLAITGYNTPVGTTAPNTAAGTVIDRSIGIADHQGLIRTSQSISDYDNSPRSVITDGTGIWLFGGGGGIRYLPLDTTTYDTLQPAVSSTQVLSSPNGKGINIADGQLYISQGSSGRSPIVKAGNGLPVTLQAAASLPGLPTTGGTVAQFFFARVQPAGTNCDVLYYMNDGDTTGIQKYSLVSGTWTYNGRLTLPENGIGLTGKQNGGTITLFATSGSKLYRYSDTAGFNSPISGDTLTTLAEHDSKKKFRGVALAPRAALALRQRIEAVSPMKILTPVTGQKEVNRLYPNPAAQYLSIRHPAFERLAMLEVTDVQGKRFITGIVQPQTTYTSVNIGMLPKGIYFITLHNTRQKFTAKFIKE